MIPQKQLNIATVSRRPITLGRESAERLPGHLIRIAGTRWALWRDAVLRGTGFPADLVLKLASADAAKAAERLLLTEAEARSAHESCLALVREALDALREGHGWDDAEQRKPLVDALRQLTKGKLPRKLPEGGELARSVEALAAARHEVEAAQALFRQNFQTSSAEVSEVVRDFTRDGRFCEAVIWQNRHAYRTALSALQKESGASNGKRRQHEELVASYLQRYCVKNDTIGFFGPVCWSKLTDARGAGIDAKPGSGLLDARNVHYESYCVDALAEKFSRDGALLPWLAPRLLPYFHLEGNTLHLPFGQAVKLQPAQAALFRMCDGERTARQIVAALTSDPASGFRSAAEVYQHLGEMKKRGHIVWALELPTEVDAEIRLKTFLEGVEDEGVRRPALAQLERLEERRREVADAAGDPERLDTALEQLDATFSEITNTSATRAESAGQTYAARTLLYEDCHRDLRVEVGPEVLKELEPPLTLLLTSARWFIHQVWEFYRRALKEKYDELKSKTGSTVINGVTFWNAVQPLLLEKEKNPALQVIQPLFQSRWAQILQRSEGGRRAEYRSEDLRRAVEEAFAVPRQGWGYNCYHSPDVMIAAKGLDAIRRGDYSFVLGEMHIGVNTLRGALFVAQHPEPGDLMRAVDLDLPGDRVMPALPKQWEGVTARTTVALVPEKYRRLVVTHDTVGVPKSKSLPIGSILIEEVDGEVVARTHDGKWRMSLLEFFSDILLIRTVNHFKLNPSLPHTPRITFDRLIVSREAWSFTAAEAAFAFEKDASERFIAARRWARSKQMPRFVFVKTPVERKPFYVDFDSSIYVDILCKYIRRVSESERPDELIGASEMMPRHEEAWLTDAVGQHYASEFRIVVLDMAS